MAAAPATRSARSTIGPGCCSWVVDDDGVYRASCGEKHEFIHAGPAENGYRFCPYCGRLIVEREGEDV